MDLFYLGERDYVNGLTLFEEMLKSFIKCFSRKVKLPFLVTNFKVNKFVRHNAELVYYQSGDIQFYSRLKKASARIDVETTEDSYILLLFENNDFPVKRWLSDYDRSVYIKKAFTDNVGNTTVSLINLNDTYGLLRGIIEANHRYVTEEARKVGGEKSVSFAYLTNFKCLDKIGISQVNDVNFKVTSDFVVYDRRFIIRSFHIEGLGDDLDSELCFFIS